MKRRAWWATPWGRRKSYTTEHGTAREKEINTNRVTYAWALEKRFCEK